MMDELLLQINAAVLLEYLRASVKYGDANHSSHESYSVILEELDEAMDESRAFISNFNEYWDAIKKNDFIRQKDLLPLMENLARRAAAEWVQVAAMCYKAAKPNAEADGSAENE